MPYRWLLIMALSVGLATRADAQAARVERRGPAEVAAQPGETVTLPFRVTTLLEAAAVIHGYTTLPEGWRATTSAPHELAPGKAELRLLGVRIPANAAAGRYVVRYAAGRSADSTAVVVAARRDVVVQPAAAAAMVVAGDEYLVRFRIINRGNVAERLSVRAHADGGTAPRADSSVLLLAPATERTITVRAPTDRRTTTNLRHQVTLYVAEQGNAASARTLVTVVPRGSGRAAGRRLPAEVRVRAADSLSLPGFSFRAHGALDRAGTVRLDLEARTADPSGSPFRREDAYRLRLETPRLSVRAGDDLYALSRLTEPGRYAFGVGAAVRHGLLSAGGILAHDRRGQRRGGIGGGFLRIGGSRALLGVVFAAPEATAPYWTIQGTWNPFPLLHVEVEAAPQTAATKLPRSLRAWGDARFLSYEVLHVRGATGGGTGSGDQDVGTVTVRPFDDFYLSASARRGVDFPLFGDTATQPATAHRVALGWGSRIAVEYRQTVGAISGRGDLAAVRLRFGVPLFRGVRLQPAYEAGKVVPEPGAEPARFRIVSLQTTLYSQGGRSVWAYAQLHEGASATRPVNHEWSGALTAHLPVLRDTWVRVSAQGRLVGGRPAEALLDLSLERALDAGHRMSMRGLATAGSRPRGFAEYALPVALPLPSKQDDHVGVRLFDPATGRGIPGVLVRLSDRVAVSDRRGVVGFSGLPAGEHMLRIEPGAGPERVPDREMPVRVTVGGPARRLEIGLAPAARLTGMVRRVPAGAAPDSSAAMPGIEVEIYGPGGVRRLQTDAEGHFDTSGLRPGLWRVQIADGSLPRHHEPPDPQILLLTAGGTTHAILRAVEKERPIQIIQSGDLTVP